MSFGCLTQLQGGLDDSFNFNPKLLILLHKLLVLQAQRFCPGFGGLQFISNFPVERDGN
jgi:hypothetical protein